jgi:hypothetical protein
MSASTASPCQWGLALTRAILLKRRRQLASLAQPARRLAAVRVSLPHLRTSRNQSIARWLTVIALSLLVLTAALVF